MSKAPRRTRRASLVLIGALCLAIVLASVGAAGPIVASTGQTPPGLDPRIARIMDASVYRYGEWGLLETDPATGRVIQSVGPAQRMYVQGSTTKLFVVSTALNDLGFDHRFTTPLYALGHTSGGTLSGTLVLVAQGDLTMGGRTKPDGSVDYTDLDHGDASNFLSGVTLTPEDPLAGLNQLAQQVRASGITHVDGDVVIDDRLFQSDPNLDPGTNPMMLNDNLFDVVVTPGAVGAGPGSVTWRPQVAPYHLDAQVKTVAAGQPTDLAVQPFPDGHLLVSGTIAADAGQQVRIAEIPDPAAFARTALIEALGRAGVSVSATPTGANPTGELPSAGGYQGEQRVATYVSPPLSEYTTLIFKISSNVGADLMLCLLAAKSGSTNCEDGFPAIASFLAKAHVDAAQVVLTDAHGGPNDRFTPQVVSDLLRYWLGRPEFAQFRQMLPILGEHGNLSGICGACPATGKVFAKPGTAAAYDAFNNRLFLSEALGGYLEVKPGQFEIFDVAINNAVVPFTGVDGVFNDLANISAYLQEADVNAALASPFAAHTRAIEPAANERSLESG
jgi:D-alanyl-D-alanine carboxypeptidase/D-alanyl-D-alanine-endopeptidase (penicillin-binding protein 4)